MPIEVASRDYDYADPRHGELRSFATEEGGRAHRIFQVPRDEADLGKRVELMHHTPIVGLVASTWR